MWYAGPVSVSIMEEPYMDTHDTLSAFSEWLDSEGLIKSDTQYEDIVRALTGTSVVATGQPTFHIDSVTAHLIADVLVKKPDIRSHDALAAEFIKQWEDRPNTAPLAGRNHPASPNLGLATTRSLIDELAARAQISEIAGEGWPRYTTVDGQPTSRTHSAEALGLQPVD